MTEKKEKKKLFHNHSHTAQTVTIFMSVHHLLRCIRHSATFYNYTFARRILSRVGEREDQRPQSFFWSCCSSMGRIFSKVTRKSITHHPPTYSSSSSLICSVVISSVQCHRATKTFCLHNIIAEHPSRGGGGVTEDIKEEVVTLFLCSLVCESAFSSTNSILNGENQ